MQGRFTAVAARTAVVLATVLGVALGTTGSASAHVVTGGWSDNDQLCQVSSCVNTGNLVRLWQSMLWVENLYSDIDGDFGPNTASATAKWQRLYNSREDPNIDIDGWVGSQTWRAAERTGLYHWYDEGPYEKYSYLGYGTPAHAFNMRKHKTTGVWSFEHPFTKAWLDTSHGS
ncbi:peptidoglycan-binding protein [Dactylosporangium siamense]|uniref:Peptidoglycan binding-like domain-containing protein n=1 Tax=Dactylosporangium siamense TaxID=685454 RepID=A0A919PKC0_9ACTN|nr:peptidoglycan-binding domain-containing protein [Dactylosporangium siamense]GIG43748.1 hypothetical protein Dsi01nite_017890 [Dactylosporangium siamense]